MRTFFSGLAAAFAFFFISAAPAAAESIDCPLSQARRTVTNDLPSGWWTTPLVNNLSDTRVQDIGGEPALMCIYGPSGSIQRNAPPNTTCRARTGGFECTPRIRMVPMPMPMPTPTPTPSTPPAAYCRKCHLVPFLLCLIASCFLVLTIQLFLN
jgi:hypothetical protein